MGGQKIHCYSITLDTRNSSVLKSNLSFIYIQLYSPIDVNAPTTKEELYSLLYNTFKDNVEGEFTCLNACPFKDTINKNNYLKKGYITNFEEDEFMFANPLGDLNIEIPISSVIDTITITSYKMF